MPHLVIIRNQQELGRRDLRRAIVVGRSSRCDLQLDDQQASRQHCRFEPQGDHWLVVDLGSHNGTLVNGSDVKQHVLAEGDRIEVGETELVFGLASVESNRPRDPHEAHIQARIANEADAVGAGDTITSPARRPLPNVKLPRADQAARLRRQRRQAAPLAFTRPMPRPLIEGDDEGEASTAEAEGLFGRLLSRWWRKGEQGGG